MQSDNTVTIAIDGVALDEDTALTLLKLLDRTHDKHREREDYERMRKAREALVVYDATVNNEHSEAYNPYATVTEDHILAGEEFEATFDPLQAEAPNELRDVVRATPETEENAPALNRIENLLYNSY